MNPNPKTPTTDARINKGDRDLAVRRVRQLHLIAHACQSAAEDPKVNDADAEFLTMAGWTIVTAARERLLNSVLDLSQILKSHDQTALNRGIPKLPRLDLAPKTTIEQYLKAVGRRIWLAAGASSSSILPLEKKPKSKTKSPEDRALKAFNRQLDALHKLINRSHEANVAKIEAEKSMAEIAAAIGDYAARRVVESAWDFLVRQHVEQHSGRPARVFIDDTKSNDRSRLPEALVRASWVCGFLGEAIVVRFGVGARTGGVAAASQLGFLQMEDIRKKYPSLTEDKRDLVRKNLENWRKRGSNETKCILSEADPDTGRRRYAYPAEKVDLIVQRALSSK